MSVRGKIIPSATKLQSLVLKKSKNAVRDSAISANIFIIGYAT